MNKRFAAFANLTFSLAGLGFNIVSGLFFVPLYLRHIDDGTYGAWLASGGVISMLGLVESGLSTVLTQKLAAAIGANDKNRFAILSVTGAGTAAFVGFGVAILGSLVAVVAPPLFGCPSEQLGRMRVAIVLSALGSGAMMLSYSLGAVAQALQQTIRQGVVVLLAMASGVGVIWSGFNLGLGVVSFGCGSLCVGLVMLAGNQLNKQLLWRKFDLPRRRFNSGIRNELWQDARSLLLTKVSSAVASNLQSPAAALTVSPEASTVLALTSRVLSLVPLLADRIGSAVFAGVAHLSQRSAKERDDCLREILTITTVVSGLGIGLAVCFTKPLVILWVGERRYAGDLVLWILVGSSFLGIRQAAYSNMLIALGEIRSAAWWMAADSVLRLALLLLLAPLFRLSGIPTANLIASGIVAVGLATLLVKCTKLAHTSIWFSGAMGFILCLCFGLAWSRWLPRPATWVQLAWQGSTCVVCMLILTVAFDCGWRRALLRNLQVLTARTTFSTAARTAARRSA